MHRNIQQRTLIRRSAYDPTKFFRRQPQYKPNYCRCQYRRVMIESGVQKDESGGGLVDLCYLDSIFEFDPDHYLRQVIETA